MVIDHPKMKARLVATYMAHRASPREALARLSAVFDGDNARVTEFVKYASGRKTRRQQ